MYQRRVTRRPRSGGGDHFFEGGIAAREDQVHGGFAVFVGKSEAVAGGLFAGGFGGAAGVDEIFRDAAIDELDLLARDAFAVEGRAELEGMIGVVGDGDIFAEERFAHAVVEAGAFVLERGGGEIVEEEADEIEYGGGLENDGVAAGWEFAGVHRQVRFFAGALSELLRIEGADAGGVGFGPARGGIFLHGDGEFGVRFAVGGEQSARIAEGGLLQAAGENAGGDLAVLDGKIASAADGAGAFFGSEGGSVFCEAIYFAIALLAGERKQMRIFWLAVR